MEGGGFHGWRVTELRRQHAFPTHRGENEFLITATALDQIWPDFQRLEGLTIRMLRRPQSLAEIARESSVLEDFGRHVRDFLHEWKRAKRDGKNLAAMLGEKPPLLATAFSQGDVCDAFLAALGEHLAEQTAIAAPGWVRGAGRHLAEPWYPTEGEVLREGYRRDALRSFRERNLFVPASALAVA